MSYNYDTPYTKIKAELSIWLDLADEREYLTKIYVSIHQINEAIRIIKRYLQYKTLTRDEVKAELAEHWFPWLELINGLTHIRYSVLNSFDVMLDTLEKEFNDESDEDSDDSDE